MPQIEIVLTWCARLFYTMLLHDQVDEGGQSLLARDAARGVVFTNLWHWPLYCVGTGLLTIVITFSVFFGTGMDRHVPVTTGHFIVPTISRTGGRNPTAPVFTQPEVQNPFS